MKIVSLLLILFAAFIFSACAGHTWESPLKVVSALFYSDDLTSRLLTEWRLPRVITAGFTGALLGISGAIFQGVFRNPLAEPWLLGSSGGAAIGGTVALLVPLGLPL
ncbi:ABC transporter permease, partial [Morganella morganii]